MSMKRRAFIGTAGIGAVAATVGATRAYDSYQGGYERLRPAVSHGVGTGEAASMSIVWLPAPGREQSPPFKARLVIFDLGGNPLADKEVFIAPFSGASVDYALPKGVKRQQVFGYAWIDGLTSELIEEIFGGFDVFNVLSGRSSMAAGPAPIA